MGYLREYYERIARLTEQEWEFIASRFELHCFGRFGIVTRQGQTENYLSFIESGLVRFYIPAEENELTFHFSFGREFISAYESFLTRTPSDYQVQALADTRLWRISYDNLQEVYESTHAGNLLGRVAAEKLFLAKSKRALSFLRFSATERYLRLFEEEPELLRTVPLKYIASYIGVTPQALSRIRRRIS